MYFTLQPGQANGSAKQVQSTCPSAVSLHISWQITGNISVRFMLHVFVVVEQRDSHKDASLKEELLCIICTVMN